MKQEASLYTKSLNLNRALKAEYCQHFLKVIGDKKGGRTSQILINPDKVSILEEIRQVVQVPMKFIHVFRNPFDNIATILLRRDGSRNKVRGEEVEKVREGGKGGNQPHQLMCNTIQICTLVIVIPIHSKTETSYAIIEGCVFLGESKNGFVISDHSYHDTSKEPTNARWTRIPRFLQDAP